MSPRRSWFNCLVLLSLALFTGMLAGCSSDSSSNTESLRIYEMIAEKGSFTAVDGDTTATAFQISLSNVPSDILYFTNRGAQEGGYDTVDNVMNNIWPRVYGSVAPNAIMKATTANQGYIELFCILNNPVYNNSTGQLSFTITYLDGQRPVSNLAVTDVKIIILNNAAQVQPEVWSHLLAGDVGTFEPTATDGTYTFRIQKTIGDVFAYTSAPQRKSSTTSVKEYIQSWQTRFGSTPPNTSIAYDPQNNLVGAVQIVTLTNPVYDENTGSISFTAKLLYGTAPIGASGLTVNSPSLFIDGGGSGFPTYAGNVFSIQYRNSTSDAITVWFGGDQPPCSQAEAANCDAGKINDEYSKKWSDMYTSGAFRRSGTHFYITRTDGTTDEIPVSNHIDLAKGETLRIVPTITGGIPEWYYKRNGIIETAGVVGWVTKKSISMPAPEPVTVYEYNLDSPKKNIVFDLSAVNGVNANATMTYEGPGCGDDVNCKTGVTLPKVLKTNIDAYNGTNDGCPYIMQFGLANSCPNPKFYPATFDRSKTRPAWVVSPVDYTTDKVKSEHLDIWNTAGSPTGAQMASAASGLASVKPAYHIWWSTNPVAQGWLTYLQKNAKGTTDAYGWAYDEKRWKTNDTFDKFGNPPDNKDVKALVTGPSLENTYLNIDILKVM